VRKTLFAALFMLLCFGVTAHGSVSVDMPIDIMVNKHYIKTDVRPLLISGVTYVPIRFVGEALGAQVAWDSNTRTAMVTDRHDEITMQIGSEYGYVNGWKVKVENKILLEGDRTFAPVRFICESLGATVGWDGAHLTVIINKDGVAPPKQAYNRGYVDDDVYWLGRIINAEAEGEPMNGKIGVGNVVLNRVRSNLYPDTIYDVIFDTNNGVQFEPILNGRIQATPSFDSLVAAKYCLQGESVVGESLFFLNPKTSTSFWIPNNRQYLMALGNHSFYL